MVRRKKGMVDVGFRAAAPSPVVTDIERSFESSAGHHELMTCLLPEQPGLEDGLGSVS